MNNSRTCIEDTLVPHSVYANASAMLEQTFDYSGTPEPTCVAIVGEARTGKSRLLEEFRENHPPTRNADCRETPVLSVRVPAKPTVKGLVELLLHALGDPLPGNGTVTTKTLRLKKLIKKSKTKVVMLDEFQHFQDKASEKICYEVADWLKILVDDTKVALVVAGLPSCQAVISQNEQLAGRFNAAVRMPRFDWAVQAQRDEFVAILHCFYQSMRKHFDVFDFSEQPTAFRLYCGTGGLIGYVSKLLRAVVRNAISTGKIVITYQDLATAYANSIWETGNGMDSATIFNLSVSLTPIQPILSGAAQVGTPVPSAPRRRGRQQPSVAPSIGQILSTR